MWRQKRMRTFWVARVAHCLRACGINEPLNVQRPHKTTEKCTNNGFSTRQRAHFSGRSNAAEQPQLHKLDAQLNQMKRNRRPETRSLVLGLQLCFVKPGEVLLCVLGSRFGGWVKQFLLHLSVHQSLVPEPFGPCSCGGSNYGPGWSWKKLVLMAGAPLPNGRSCQNRSSKLSQKHCMRFPINTSISSY